VTGSRTAPEPATHGRQVARAIEDVAQRLFRVRLVRHGYVWAAGGVATAAIATVARGLAPVQALAWLAGALVASLAAAWCTARYRRPDAAAAARTIDTALDLRGLVEAARELASEQDAVSALVVRDASRRVAGLSPEATVPLRGPGRRAASGLAAAAVAWLTVVSLVGRTAPTTRPGASGAGGTGAVTAIGPATEGTPEQVEAVNGAPPAGATDAGSTRTDGGAQSDAVTKAPERAADGTPQASDTPDGNSPTPAVAGPQNGSAAALGRGGAGDGAAGGRGALAAREPQRNPAGSQADAGRDAASGAPGGQGRAATATTAEATPGSGGGVTGGQALGEAPPAIAGSRQPPNVGDEARYRAARARAESPGGQARIPPDFRRLVHDYFIAIGPGTPE